MYKWALSPKMRNLAAHISNGNTRLPEAARAHMFSVLVELRDTPREGRRVRAHSLILSRFGLDVAVKTLGNHIARYEANGYVFTVKDSPRSGRKRLLGEIGVAEVVHELRTQPTRKVARSAALFESASGDQITVSRGTLRNVAAREGLVVSLPKTLRISNHCAHHLAARVAYCRFWLLLSQAQQRRIVYADEMNFPMTVSFNAKNDVISVPKGQQSTTNLHRVAKGSTGKFCSIFLTCNFWGVVSYYVFFEKFTKRFYQGTILPEHVKPLLRNLRGHHRTASFYYHDGATHQDLHDDEKLCDDVFGNCSVIPFMPPICLVDAGREHITPYNREAYWRKKSMPSEECLCEFKEMSVASASPELNLVENANGYLRYIWEQQCGPNGPLTWGGGRKKRIDVLEKCIQILSEDKSFFQKMYDGAPERHKFVAENNGAMYRSS